MLKILFIFSNFFFTSSLDVVRENSAKFRRDRDDGLWISIAIDHGFGLGAPVDPSIDSDRVLRDSATADVNLRLFDDCPTVVPTGDCQNLHLFGDCLNVDRMDDGRNLHLFGDCPMVGPKDDCPTVDLNRGE